MKKVPSPVFKMSGKAQTKIAKAQKDHRKGKTVKLKSIDDLDRLTSCFS